MEREVVQEKNQIRRFLWIGKKLRARQWPAGAYVGRTTVTPREGSPKQDIIGEVSFTVTDTKQ